MTKGPKPRPAIDRFNDRAHKLDNGCWLWIGAKDKDGNGLFWRETRRSVTAQRAAYLIFRGEIPPNSHVRRKCKTRGCVNPGHLYLLVPEEEV